MTGSSITETLQSLTLQIKAQIIPILNYIHVYIKTKSDVTAF